MRLTLPGDGPAWLPAFASSILRGLTQIWPGPLRLASYVVAEVPDAATYSAGLIYVTDEAGGAVPAFSDGTDWRRVTDRAVVS